MALLLLSVFGSVFAADCREIKDDDGRAYCLAMEGRSKAQCVVIKDYALRTKCSTQLGANKSGCYAIRDAWQRQKCMDAARK